MRPKLYQSFLLICAISLITSSLAVEAFSNSSVPTLTNHALILDLIKQNQGQHGIWGKSTLNTIAEARQFVQTQVSGMGGLAGTLYGLEDDDVESAFVEVFTADSTFPSGDYVKAMARVQEDGTYFIDSLAVGSYYVLAWAEGYLLKFYDNVYDISEATSVQINEGAVTEGIDFRMEKIQPGTGSISGTVLRESDSMPVADALVSAFSPENPLLFGWANTDDSGMYQISGLKSAAYYVSVWAEGFLPEFYDNAASATDADLVTVIEPNETAGIDFALSLGGSISGTVTDDEGQPIEGAYVEAMTAFGDSSIIIDPAGDPEIIKGHGRAITDDNGQYTITGLPSGDYWVRAEVWNEWMYVGEWYDDAASPEEASIVPVQDGEKVDGIDFQLSFEAPSGVIAGKVTDLEDNPIPEAYVQVQPVDDMSMRPYVWAHAITDKEGNYRIDNLPDGSYYVSAWAQSGWNFVQRWWPDSETLQGATPVVVTGDTDVGPIDFRLPLTVGTASIAGIVTYDDGHPIWGANIQITSNDSIDSAGNVRIGICAWAQSDSSGHYQVERLPAGEYVAYANYWQEDKFGQQWYDHVDNFADATPIILSAGETRDNVDFSLNVRPMYGSIVGTVVDSLSGLPISGAYVEFSFNGDDFISSIRMPWWLNYAITDENGRYQLDWLWEGEYLVSVYSNGAFEYYDNAAVAELATPIKVVGGETFEANFLMNSRNEGPGVITGQVVSDWDESPLDIAVVTARPVSTILVWPQSEMFFTAIANKDGTYEMKGLPVGEYYVMSFAPYAIGEYYDNVYDPVEATVVRVDGVNPTTGIDFSLGQMWFFRGGDWKEGVNSGANVVGKVTDNTGRPLSGAIVYLLNENGQAVASVRTNSDGTYSLNGIPPGNYIVQAGHLGYSSLFNGRVNDLAQATPIQIGAGTLEVNFSLSPQSSTHVMDNISDNLPTSAELYGNYPNPFNPETRISFALPRAMHIRVQVFNIFGEQVVQIFDGSMNAGIQSLIWNGRNNVGQPVSSGVYVYRLDGESKILTGKMILMR